MADTRRQLIEATLERAMARQQAGTIAGLDLAQIARELDAALDGQAPLQPLDPEGDGLENDELNAANDI